MVYHSDEIPLDIGFSLTGLLPMCIETSIQSKLHILVLRPLL